ncbi:GNAT family N-acetyltransferase [bacterium]|nr:GNAT family N-acetyltransferase [bacterium]MCB2178958.1 GNAT family N-acetyltransferase [bacterium]
MTTNWKTTAYRIETERLVLRCADPKDAPLLSKAINESLDHLKEWMPWAHNEPEPIEEKAARLKQFRASFDLDQDYIYLIFNPDESRMLGSSGLHTRVGQNALEIGYWIHVDFINQGLATEVAAALTKVAFEINQVERVEIHCDPENVRSARVPEKLGFIQDAILRQRVKSPQGEPRDAMIWSMLAEEYPASLPNQANIQAFDALGRKIQP